MTTYISFLIFNEKIEGEIANRYFPKKWPKGKEVCGNFNSLWDNELA